MMMMDEMMHFSCVRLEVQGVWDGTALCCEGTKPNLKTQICSLLINLMANLQPDLVHLQTEDNLEKNHSTIIILVYFTNHTVRLRIMDKESAY